MYLLKSIFGSHLGLTPCKTLTGIDNNWPSNLSITTAVSWVISLLYKTSFCVTNYQLLYWGVRSYAKICQMFSISARRKNPAVNPPFSNKHLTLTLSKTRIFANYFPLQWDGNNLKHEFICKAFSLFKCQVSFSTQPSIFFPKNSWNICIFPVSCFKTWNTFYVGLYLVSELGFMS